MDSKLSSDIWRDPAEIAFAYGSEMCVTFLLTRFGVAPCPGTLTWAQCLCTLTWAQCLTAPGEMYLMAQSLISLTCPMRRFLNSIQFECAVLVDYCDSRIELDCSWIILGWGISHRQQFWLKSIRFQFRLNSVYVLWFHCNRKSISDCLTVLNFLKSSIFVFFCLEFSLNDNPQIFVSNFNEIREKMHFLSFYLQSCYFVMKSNQ